MSTLKTDSIQPTLSTSNISFKTGANNVERFRIQSNGQILVPSTTGTTFDGQVNFSNTTRFPGGIQVGGGIDSTKYTALDVVHTNVSLGIPDAVNYNTTRSRSNMMVRASGTNTTLFFGNNSSTSSWLQVQNSDNNVYGLSLNPVGGNVGIGVSAPNETLHIGGNFRIGNAVMSVPTGSAPLYNIRAWVNFNGTTILASQNIYQVQRFSDAGGKPYYRFFFTTRPPSSNYCTVASHNMHTGGGVSSSQIIWTGNLDYTEYRFYVNGSETDVTYGCVMWIW